VQLLSVVGNVTVFNAEQPEKHCVKLVIEVAFEGNVMLNKFVQFKNAVLTLVNELAEVGITTTYKFEEALNIDAN
jgi:hypothetical protein